MTNLKQFICKIFAIFFVENLFFLSLTFADSAGQEGIFIETISELNNGRLLLDEVRTRPIDVLFSGKKVSIEADGYYITDSNLQENTYVAQDRARSDARRSLSEQASVHIKSNSVVQNGKLTVDEIHTLSAIILQVKDESVTRETLEDSTVQYHCHITALIDIANVLDQLNSADKEKFSETVRRTIEIEKESARLNAELNALKQKYKTASNSEREKISAELKHNEELFTATMWSEKGFELYSKNDFKGAVECFNSAVKINPNYAVAWAGLGCVANYQREFDKAIEYCYKAAELDKNSSSTWNNLGYAYSYKGNLERAVECYKQAIEIDPANAIAQVNLGNVYDSSKNYDAAVECYQKALEISPNYVNAFNSLGYTYIQKGDFDSAILYLQKAVELDPHYAAAWNGLGYSYNQKKKFYKAVECCRKAVALSKNYANAWNNLGYACSKISRYEDSFTAYRNAVKNAPNVKLYRDNLEIARTRIDSFKSL